MYDHWKSLLPDEPSRSEKAVIGRWEEMNQNFKLFLTIDWKALII